MPDVIGLPFVLSPTPQPNEELATNRPAVMYSTALEFGATFWTFDVDYKGLPMVKYKAKG